ncbi:MAG: HAMP domain-containing histidine kinase [Lachnospiraceae bacterium]|nr:HAMP domain-containing histidine kinase [Lachnospiraceae bacterium]
MRFRSKLLIMCLVLTLLPMALAYLGLVLFGSIQFSALQNNTDKNLIIDVFSTAAIQIFDDVTADTQAEISQMVIKDPVQFMETETLDRLNSRLAANYSYLVVTKNDQPVYCGNPLDDLSWLNQSAVGEIEEGNNVDLMFFEHMLVKEQNIRFPDGQRGHVYIVTATRTLAQSIRSVFAEIGLLIVVVLGLIALITSAWIYGTMVQPIHMLQKAAKEIKDGNLDFEVDTSDKGEIGDLCRDFEEMRKRLKDTSEEKIQFDAESKTLISNISHDLKTPVTTIKGYAEGILDGVASSPEKMEKYIRTIYNKANDMDRLIDELTLYSKIDTNRIPYTFAKINIADYFRDCVEEMTIELEARNIDLSFFNYLDDDVIVIADVEQLRRVVNNIIGNSAKYMDKKKGIINIRLKDVGDFVQIEIEDNGKGIAAKDLPYIFDRFYRTDSSRTSSTGGSGIGLSIVRKIIEDHGGKIWATSKESTGTVMCFVLRKYQEVINE